MQQFYEMIKPSLHIYLPLLVVYLLFVIYCVINLIKQKNFSTGKKVLWFLIIMLVQVIGPIAYLLVGRKRYE